MPITSETKTVFPPYVTFELTYKCNLSCCHCCVVSNPDRQELTTGEIKSIFDQLSKARCQYVLLTGGEPLMRKDFLTLIDHAGLRGLSIHIFTNATLITSHIAKELNRPYIISVGVSFHSMIKKRFDWLTQADDSFDKVMKAIDLLKGIKKKVYLKINMNKLNVDEFPALKKFAKNFSIPAEWSFMLKPKSDGSRENLFLRLEPERYLKVANISYSNFTVKNTNVAGNRLFRCGAGKGVLAINPYGELKPCLSYPWRGYPILKSSLVRAQKKLVKYIDSLKPDPESKCSDCRLKDFCSMCPVRAILDSGDINGCPDYYKRIAELIVKNNEHSK